MAAEHLLFPPGNARQIALENVDLSALSVKDTTLQGVIIAENDYCSNGSLGKVCILKAPYCGHEVVGRYGSI